MAGHTPGPWANFPRHPAPDDLIGVQSLTGLIVANCGPAGNSYSQANARLIAAAPDLLEALRDVLLAPGEGVRRDAAMSKARAAIAKAEGR